jgi:hypothetical protein
VPELWGVRLSLSLILPELLPAETVISQFTDCVYRFGVVSTNPWSPGKHVAKLILELCIS